MRKVGLSVLLVMLVGCTAVKEEVTVEEQETTVSEVSSEVSVEAEVESCSNPVVCKALGLESMTEVPEEIKVEELGVIDGYHHLEFYNGLISTQIAVKDDLEGMKLQECSWVGMSDGGKGIDFGLFFVSEDTDSYQLTYFIVKDEDWIKDNREVISEENGYILIKEETGTGSVTQELVELISVEIQ